MLTLDSLITIDRLKKLAGATAFQRGEEYFTSGLVDRLLSDEQKIAALVNGTETYRVKLWPGKGDELSYDCTCPRAGDGYFCKHCVAVGLAWRSERQVKSVPEPSKAKKKRSDPWQVIRDYLTQQAQETLISLVLEAAQRDDRLYQSLLLKAERAGAGNIQQVFRKAISQATRIRGFLDWDEAGGYAENLGQLVDSMAELLTPDNAADLVELAEYAIERVEDAMQNIDDSNGDVGGIVGSLGDLHLKACEIAHPEPVNLAERLFRMETTLPMNFCSFRAERYQQVLGEAGLTRYREIASIAWQKLKPKQANDRFDGHTWRLTSIMESLARAGGNVEELVAIKARDLTHAYNYLVIAEIWAKEGQDNKALEWAERGLKAFPKATDNRLRDFLVAAYLVRKRQDEAMQLTWVQFEEAPSLEHYKKLHKVAAKLKIWTEQRERALAYLSENIARNAGKAIHWNPKPATPNYSLRVEIALWENDLDAAWSAVNKGVCAHDLLTTLAGKLESGRGNDAIALYRRVIPLLVEQTNNTAYADAVKLIRKVGAIMSSQQQQREYGYYLDELRARFKAKRNFIKLLSGMF